MLSLATRRAGESLATWRAGESLATQRAGESPATGRAGVSLATRKAGVSQATQRAGETPELETLTTGSGRLLAHYTITNTDAINTCKSLTSKHLVYASSAAIAT